MNVQNIKIKACQVFWGGEDLGYIDGAIELATEETVFDITTHQTGTQVIGNIRTGLSVEVTMNLKESDVAKLKKILSASGGAHTPEGSGTTELFGWGTEKQFTGTFADAKRLVLHPMDMGDSKAEDWNFWKAYPILNGSLQFSGEEAQTIPLTFKIYMDTTKPKAINMFAIGDGSQIADQGATAAVKASKKIQDILWVAKTAGAAGNNIEITYADTNSGGGASVSVANGTEITVSIEAGVTTAGTIADAVSGHAEAGALVEGIVDPQDENRPQDATDGAIALEGGADAT